MSRRSSWALLFVVLVAVVTGRGTGMGADGAEMRTWTDATGRFSLTAKFGSLDGDQVILERENGEKMAIPLAKLSAADQQYVASQKDENPFQSLGSSPFAPVAPKMEAAPSQPAASPAMPQAVVPQGVPRVVKVDWTRSQAVPLTGAEEEWKAQPPTPLVFEPKPSPTGLPAKTDFFEKMAGVAINTVAKKAVVGYTLAKPGNSQSTTRVLMCDIAKGQVLETAAAEGQMAPLALHDNGQHILMRRDEFGFGNLDRLEVWAIQGGQVVRSVSWTPYEGAFAGGKDVMWAEFMDASTLATSSRGGKVALWDIGTIRPICHFDLTDGAVPAMSADRKWIAFCAKDRVGLFDVAARKIACIQATPSDLTWPYVAFSPSGKRLACIAQDRILVWDTATGKLEQDFTTPGISIHGAIDFPHDEYLLGANQYLIALETRLKMWHYQGAEYVRTLGGVTFMVVSPHGDGGVLAATKMPHEQAVELYQKALKQPDIFVFRKGSTVKLNVSTVPAAEQGRVRDALTKKLQAMDCKIASEADVEVAAGVDGPKTKEISYMHSGDYKVQEYITWLKFLYQGKLAWQTSSSNVPYFLTLKKGENIEGKLREAGKQPGYGFYDHVVLPEFLQKPSEGPGTAGGGQTLGSSRVTTRGFQ
ncbi:MAG: SHD1 domain-containing protein [Thermoguttaceae bacterium]